MASFQNQTQCPSCDCSDSPLSVIGNIVGLLTFSVAVYASASYYYRGLRASAAEMNDMVREFELISDDLGILLRNLQRVDHDKLQNPFTKVRLVNAVGRAVLALEMGTTFLRLGAWKPQCTPLARLRNKAAYIREKEKFVTILGKLEELFRDLKEVAADVISQQVCLVVRP